MSLDASPKPQEWMVGSLRLTLDEASGALVPQTPDGNILSTLARARLEGASRCALDLIFRWGYKCVETSDALVAYSEAPLACPPQEYVAAFYEVDWTKDNPSEQMRAIILAGTQKEEEKQMLLRILGNLGEDFRDAALYAASTFEEDRFIQAVSKIAMSVTEASSFATAEMGGFIACYKRWLERGVTTLEDLTHLLRSLESPDPRLMRAERLINHVFCPDWDRVPFPNAPADESSEKGSHPSFAAANARTGAMSLYEVVFPCLNGRADDVETIYLVRAPDVRAAIREATMAASPKEVGVPQPRAKLAYEIGKDLSVLGAIHPRVLRGPYFEPARNRGWRGWRRLIEGPDDTLWEEVKGSS